MNKTNATTPLLDDIVAQLRSMTRGMRRGDRMPTVRALVRDFGVSQVTVTNAINLLRQEGLLVSHVGRGTFFMGKPSTAGASLTNLKITILKEDYPSRRDEAISQELHRRCAADGHRSLIVTYSDESHAIEMLSTSAPADAYVLQTPKTPMAASLLNEIQRHTRTIVVLSSAMSGVDADIIGVNYTRSIELAIRHLRELGHHRICFASGEQIQRIKWRIQAFSSMHSLAGLEPADPLLLTDCQSGESPTAQMQSMFKHILAEQRPLPFTALMVWSYASAIGVLHACDDAGLKVPDELSLVVADNPDIDARYSGMMTMVGRPTVKMAESAYRRLIHRINHPGDGFISELEEPELVVRHSTRAIT